MSTLPPTPEASLRPKPPFRISEQPESGNRTKHSIHDTSDTSFGFSYDQNHAQLIVDSLNAFFQIESLPEAKTMLDQLKTDQAISGSDVMMVFHIKDHGSLSAKLRYLGKDYVQLQTTERVIVFRIDQIVGYSI